MKVKCPKCDEAFDVEAVAKLARESVMHLKIGPAPGELLDAKTVGGSLKSMRDLLHNMGKEIGVPVETVIKNVTYENGSIDFELLVIRFEEAIARRQRMKKHKKNDQEEATNAG